MTKLFLTGYEKKEFDTFLNKLEDLKVKALIDVREIPLSRKNEFSKTALEENLNEHGIRYYHFPKLGSPRRIRKRLYSTGDYLNFFTEYRNYIDKQESSVEELTEIVLEEESSALFCYEKDYELCHRSIITDEITEINKNIWVTPI